MARPTFGECFAGIGGLSLGLCRAGWEPRWFIEIDPFCQRVLRKHWPEVKQYGDIRQLDGSELEAVDLVAGGWPCQPHSYAGKRLGSRDERDMWVEFIRIIRAVKPPWVLGENVPGVLSSDGGRYFGAVLRDLAESGFDAEWQVLPAAAFGAPHIRERLFIMARHVAYTESGRCGLRPAEDERQEHRKGDASCDGCEVLAHTAGKRCGTRRTEPERQQGKTGPVIGGSSMADADRERLPKSWAFGGSAAQSVIESYSNRGRWWSVEPNVGRVAHGIPARVDRLRSLGNAVVPQVAEWLGRRILEANNRG